MVNCSRLPIDKVKEASGEEMGFMQHTPMWDIVPERECWERTGKAPVSGKWVDTNKEGRGI